MSIIQQSGNRGISFNLGAASSPSFVLLPGKYRAVVIAACGAGAGPFTGNGSIDLSILAADGSTYAPITNVNFALASQVANGSRIYDLSGGTYSFQVVGTVSGAYASIAPAQA
jgi:hypothetical protein